MDTTDLLTHIIGDMARAVSERPGETQEQRSARAQVAAQTVVAFQPTDAIEAMLAGHCVIFHELIVDAVRTTFRAETDTARRASRGGVVAMDKAFGNNLTRLERYRARQEEIEPLDDDVTETEIADRIERHQETDQLAGLNRKARRQFDRLSRRRVVVTPTRNAPVTTPSARPAG